jgi:hypothetical protein
MENEDLLIDELNQDLQLDPGKKISLDQVRAILTGRVDDLINTNFSGLVNLLYKIDIDETKLKKLLAENEDAPAIIAELIIERQLQKINSRTRFSNPGPVADDEKW